jgi:hypothetical protein
MNFTRILRAQMHLIPSRSGDFAAPKSAPDLAAHPSTGDDAVDTDLPKLPNSSLVLVRKVRQPFILPQAWKPRV